MSNRSEASATLPNVGVFGGTFDPPHIGHLIIAAEMRFALSLDRVLFVPAGRPPHKPDRVISDDHHRLAMLRLALADAPEFEISTIDLEQDEPSYTSVLLERLHRVIGTARLIFLMGGDSLRDLPTWHEPDRIVAQAEVAVAARPAISVDPEVIYAAVPTARGRVHLIDVPEIGVSSSDLRARVAAGRPIRFQVTPAVEEYVMHHGLYQSGRPERHNRA